MTTRHGKISDNKARLSVLMDKDDKRTLAEAARLQGRSLSNFLAYQAARIAESHRTNEAPQKTTIESIIDNAASLIASRTPRTVGV